MKKIAVLLIWLLMCSTARGALVPDIEVHSVDYDDDATVTTVGIGEEVYFSASGTTYDDATLLGKARYEWDWGDGYDYDYNTGLLGESYYYIMAGGIAATHFFMAPNTYTVTLSVKIYDTYISSNYAPTITTTSTTSNELGTGNKTFTVGTLTRVLEYNTGTHAPTVGQTLYQETSGAEIEITNVTPASDKILGAWDGDGVGWLYFTVTSGTLVAGQHLHEEAAGAGQLVCNVVVPGHDIETGAPIKISSTADRAKYFYGTVTTFNAGTGELVMDADYKAGTGTYADWTVTVDALPVASDTTTTQIVVSGTAPLSGFEVQHAPFYNRSKQYLYVQIPTAHRNTTTQLKVSLIGAISGTTVLLAPKDNLAAEEILLFDQTSLAADTYTVQAQLLDADDNQITGGIWQDKYVLSTTSPAVTIDENNSFKINGSFYFPMMPFLLGVSSMGKYISDAGITGAFFEGYNTTHDTTTWGKYINDANANGLYVHGPGTHSCKVTYIPSAGNYWKRNHDPDCMASYVTDSKDKAGLFSWGWQDEVNLGGYSEKVYPPTYAAWEYIARHKSGDYDHLSHSGFVGSDWSRYYGTSTTIFDYLKSDMWFGGKKWIQDWLSYDTYPVTQQLYAIQNFSGVDTLKMGTYAVALDSLDRFLSNNKNLVPFLIFSQPCKGNTPLYVTDNQIYMENWLNVIHGAKGILWFDYFNMPIYGRWDGMKKFADSVTADRGSGTRLLDVFLGAPSTRTITDTANPTNAHHPDYAQNRVDTMIRENSGNIYVFAARVTEPEPANSYMNVRLTGTAGTIVTDGTISDTGDAHVWALPVSVTIGSDGTANVIATCVDEGYVTAAVNTLTKIVTGGSAGWTAVTNTQSATAGSRYQYTEPATLTGIQFTISGLSGESTVEVLDESRSLAATDGVFTDDFDKDEVHLYRISSGTPTTYTVTVTKAGAGTGTVTSSLSGINCGSDCTEAYIAGNTIVLTATPDTASAFDGWSGAYGCTGTGTCTVTSIAANAAATATFSVKETPPTYYNMTVSHTGNGDGTTDPVEGTYSKGEGTEVSITATASDGSSFTGWSGTCGCTGSASPCTIATFPGNDCTVIADFTLDQTYNLTLNIGDGVTGVGSVTPMNCSIDGNGDVTSCVVSSDPNETINIMAECADGYYGPQWSGDIVSGAVTMTSDKAGGVSCTCGRCITLGTGGTITIGSGGGAPSSCSVETDYVGSKSGNNTNSTTKAADYVQCFLYTPTCYGPLASGYIFHSGNNQSTAKVCVYSDDGDSAPGSGDLKIGCSDSITGSSPGIASAPMDGGTLTTGNYWVCSAVDDSAANAWGYDRGNDAAYTLKYKATSGGFHDTPPANLDGTWSTTNNTYLYRFYVTVGQ